MSEQTPEGQYQGQQQGQYQSQYQAPPYGYAPPPSTNSMAVLALVAGIAGLTVIPLIGSIVAVIVGPMSRKEIARTGEEGQGLATAGIVTGWVGIGIWGAVLIVLVLSIVFSFGLFATLFSVGAATGTG